MTRTDDLYSVTSLGLEVEPAGPYMVLTLPLDLRPIPAEARLPKDRVLLARSSGVVGLRLTAVLVRGSNRYPGTMGRVHLRAFDVDGKMVWRATFARMGVPDLSFGKDRALVALDLFAPYAFEWA